MDPDIAATTDLRAVTQEEQLDLRLVELDVVSDASVGAAIEKIIAEQGWLDVVVHNARYMSFGPAGSFTDEQLVHLYDVNTLGTRRLNRAACPHLRRARSGLPLWVSMSGVRGNWSPYLPGYFAAKAGMEQLTIAYAGELARWGIETSIVVPGVFAFGSKLRQHHGVRRSCRRG